MTTETKLLTAPSVFVIDVDGVLTDGRFYYSDKGKVMKVFGPDDHDALGLLQKHLSIQFVTGDKRGYSISKARIVDDMQMPLELVSTVARLEWLRSRWDLKTIAYMGDGIFDHYVLRNVGYGIAPADGDVNARSAASYVTARRGGDRAVAEAALHLLEQFFEPFDCEQPLTGATKFGGIWEVTK